MWAFRLSLAVVIPGLPLVGAILGAIAYVQIKASSGKVAGDGFALAAVVLGTTATAVAGLVFFSVVVPGTVGVGARALQADAHSNLRAIERRVYRYHAAHGRFPEGRTDWTPPQRCCQQPGGTCRVAPQDWNTPIWQALGFTPSAPTAHQFRYERPTPDTFVLTARRDPGCPDPTPGAVLRGQIGPSGAPRSDPIQPE